MPTLDEIHHPQRKTSSPGAANQVIDAYRWAALACHAVVLLYFFQSGILTNLTKDIEPLCWPYFQSCWKIRFDTDASITLLLILQALLVATAASALAAKRYRMFWVLMVALNAYLFLVISLDYRLRQNQHYMLLWVNAVFLLWPTKRWAIPLILISFYFWAGTLKLNYEWLSGAVLYDDLYFIPARFAWLACTYVVVLEMILIWGLLATRAWLRWLTLGQLALFHIESVSQVGWFYPVLMGTLLSWFVIDWTAHPDNKTASLKNLWLGKAPRSAYLLLVLFASFQLVPYLYRGDRVLAAQGRIFSLDMLEARPVCDVRAVVHNSDHTDDVVSLLLAGFPARKICDPVFYFDRMTNLCRSHAADHNFVDADFVMHSRRATDTKLTTIVDQTNFCSQHEVYRIFSNNSWMR
jgi:hypothetical protein